jgi:hypothetical protein
MTVANLFAQHRAGKVSKEKFLYEVRRDAQLPFISNLTSYEDAIKMLKQKSVIKEAGKYDLSQRDIPGLDKNQIKTLETWINLINADLNWWNTQYPNYSGNPSIIMGDISNAFNLSIDDFVKKYENANPMSVANLVKKQISGKLVKEGVNTTDKFDVVLKNGKKYHNVTFTTHNSFETEDGVSMMNQDIAKTTKSPEKQGGLNESKKIIKEAKFGVYIPNGTKEGTKLDIAVEYKNHPYAKIYFNAEFVSDKDGTYTFNTKEGKIKIPHADLITYKKSSEKQEGLNESKKIIKEQTDLHLQIDRLNPILVKKAVNSELAKLPMIDAQVYQKMTEKVVKKLQKDPKAYDDVVVANAKEIHKIDEKSKMVPVKKELKDPHHQMKSPKGTEKIKSNTKASKTENKKGKPKGVKEMSSTAKGHKGMDQMKQPEKNHKIMESLLSFMFKKKLNEDTHHEYGVGQSIDTPDGRGTVKEIIGSTVTLEFESTGDLKDYQMNVLTHFKEEAKKPVEEKTPEVKKEMPTMDEKKDKVIQKVMEFLKKKKKMKEVYATKTKDAAQNAQIKKTIMQGSQNQQSAQELASAFDKGKTVNIQAS